MYKILITCACALFIGAGTATACGGGDCGSSTPAATANAGAQSSASIHVTPVTNNTSGSNASSVVGINNNPTNLVGGGTALAGGGGGGTGIAVAKNGNQTMVLDMHGQKTYNRQFAPAYAVGPGPGAQMFDQWGPAWNVTPITPEELEAGEIEEKIELVEGKNKFHIYRKGLEPATSVVLRGILFDKIARKVVYMPPSGIKVGRHEFVATSDFTINDALNYTEFLAMKNGANQVEIIDYNARKNPTLNDKSFGFGGSGSGIIGDAEKGAISGGGGTHISKSDIVNETQPWLSVVYWRDDNVPGTIIPGYNARPVVKQEVSATTPTTVKATAEGD